jgi:pimeloyl-ACP methyl ester carboxylesterase
VTAYDLRDHGASDVPDSGYTSADMAADLRNLHAVQGLNPALLVGYSFGAVIAMYSAVSYPDMVRGLILSDPYFPGLAMVPLGNRSG